MSVVSFAHLVHLGGVQEILVSRHKKFHLWAGPAFVFSAIFGILCFISVALMSQPLATFYGIDHGNLAILITLLGLNLPLSSLGSVSRAKLTIDMRFRELSWITFVRLTLDSVLKVLCAFLGFGVMSFAMASITAGAVGLLMSWSYVTPSINRRSFKPKRWRYLVNDSSFLFLSTIATWVLDEGDMIAIGTLGSSEIAGTYYIGTRLGRQIITTLCVHSSRAIFPALRKLSAQHRITAFVDASRLLAACVIPLCIFQFYWAQDIVETFLGSKWQIATPYLRISCLGTSLKFLSLPAIMLLQSQKRFYERLVATSVLAAIFVAIMAFQTHLGASPLLVAGETAVISTLFCLSLFSLAINKNPVSQLVYISLYPTIISIGALCVAVGTHQLLPSETPRPIALAVALLVGIIAYVTALGKTDKNIRTSLTHLTRRPTPQRLR